MSFEAPMLLLGLLLVPLAALGYWLLQRRPAPFAVRYTNLDVLAGVARGRRSWKRHLPAALMLLALAALCVGFARPTVNVKTPDERASVVLVVDVSGSMRATDVKPTRLAAAKRAMRSFLDRAPGSLKVGVVAFSDEAQVVVSPTVDREQLAQGIDLLGPGFGTAIGDAIARAVDLARTATGESGHDRSLAREGREGTCARLDPPPVRRRPDPRAAEPRPGRAASADRRDSRLHDRARHRRGDDPRRPARPGAAHPGPARPARRSARSPSTPAASRSTPRARTPSRRSTAGSGSRVGRQERPREVTSAFVTAGALLLAGAAGAASRARRGFRRSELHLGTKAAQIRHDVSDTVTTGHLGCPWGGYPGSRGEGGMISPRRQSARRITRDAALRPRRDVALRRHRRSRRGLVRGREGHRLRPDRPERRRQDDGLQRHHAALHTG